MNFDKLLGIFRDVFETADLNIFPEMSARDIEEWDSFNHINLVLSIEENFDVAFTTEEITNMQNLGDLVTVLQVKGCDIHWVGG